MRSFRDVHDELSGRHVPHEIVHLPSSSRTAQLAAEALGVPLREVVKSLLFFLDGGRCWCWSRATRRSTWSCSRDETGVARRPVAKSREVRELTGYEPGAVPPCGLATDVPVVADPGVFAPDVVYCGGGTTTTMLKIRSADLDALLEPRKLPIAARA